MRRNTKDELGKFTENSVLKMCHYLQEGFIKYVHLRKRENKQQTQKSNKFLYSHQDSYTAEICQEFQEQEF